MDLYSNNNFRNTFNETKVVGNDYNQKKDLGFTSDVSGIYESYSMQGINLARELPNLFASPTTYASFKSQVLESVMNDSVLNGDAASLPFYSNYGERLGALLDNTMKTIANESLINDYMPIQAYAPFMLKKQWISTVYKDVLMTEVPASPIINLAFQKAYLVDGTKEYEMPNVFYDEALMNELINTASGAPLDSTVAITLPAVKYDVYSNLIPASAGVTIDERTELAHGVSICSITVEDSTGTTHVVPVDIRCDVTTQMWLNPIGITYDVKDPVTGEITETLHDQIIGSVDYRGALLNISSTDGIITEVCVKGRLANRFNYRSLDVKRRIEQIQHIMPESGPRFNSPVTVEDLADAMALQNIDLIAWNVEQMGTALANFEDVEIRTFLKDSFNRQQTFQQNVHGYTDPFTVKSSFNALPYEGFNGRITEWMKDGREYFERTVSALKKVLKSEEVAIVCVSHPNTIRFLQDGINWIFTKDAELGGVTLSYTFGVQTSSQDRIHFITTQYMSEEDGIQFIPIPLTKELITFKHYKYNTILDRGYRSPVHSLVPNVMMTHRTLTFEVLPLQGMMKIDGRDLTSPDTLVRVP